MFKKILVGIDGSEESWRALDAAINIAKKYSAKLDAVSITNPGEDEKVLPFLKEAKEKAKKQRVKIDLIIEYGVPIIKMESLVKANNYDLVVLGRHEEKREEISSYIFSSVAKNFVERGVCNTLIIK